jgi:hypothetical protein
MTKLSYTLSTLLLLISSIYSFADTVNPVIDNAKADKTDSCWVVEVQLQSIFVDVTTATDDSSSLSNGLTLVANPASPQGGAEVDTRFQGTTSVTYTATDPSGNVTTQCIKYVVKDYKGYGPFGFTKTLDVSVVRVNTPWNNKMKFTDSLDGDISNKILLDASDLNTYKLGSYTVIYSVTNSRNQTFEKTIVVKVIDDLFPIILGKNGGVVKVALFATYDPLDHITLSDNYEAPSSLRDSLIIIYNDVDVNRIGIYSTVFQTTDVSGNQSNEYTLITQVLTTLGISKTVNNKFVTVYPNPATDVVNIESSVSLNHSKLSLIDALGKETTFLLNQTGKGYSLDVSSLAKGLYFLQIVSDGKIQLEKVLIR